MFDPELKQKISEQIQQLLAETNHKELPNGNISFLLHVNGKELWSWANIHDNGPGIKHVPEQLLRNTRQPAGRS